VDGRTRQENATERRIILKSKMYATRIKDK
jgi:hypothetical protein